MRQFCLVSYLRRCLEGKWRLGNFGTLDWYTVGDSQGLKSFSVVAVFTVCFGIFTATHLSSQLLLDNIGLTSRTSRTTFGYSKYAASTRSHPATSPTSQPDLVILHHANGQQESVQSHRTYQRLIDKELSVFSTSLFPENERTRPTLGNGHIATVVYSDTIYMNGLYNGINVYSHRARIPSTCAIKISSTTTRVTKTKYSLDIEKGMFIESQSGPGFTIEIKRYAHRSLDRLMVTEMVINNCCLDNFQITLTVNHGNDSEDINLNSHVEDHVRHTYGNTKVMEDGSQGGLPVYIVSTELPKNGTIIVPPGKDSSYLFLTSIDQDRNSTLEAFNQGTSEYFKGTLEDKHLEAWKNIWSRGRVDIAGEPEAAKVTYASYYYIISSIPIITDDKDLSFVGLSPGDLAHGAYLQDYQGHVFWDQETWMYPPIQMLHADFGKTLIKSRIRTLDSAKELAKQKGYKGAMFPWESCYSGFETSPSKETADYEQHITGDIAQAFYLYYTMTNDTNFMKNGRGNEVITSIADFWTSRVTLDKQSGLYHINKVMPPDEYHWPVNDSAYTNQVAKISLMIASKVNPDKLDVYKDIANNMYIPFNATGQWHPEYEGYTDNVIVKQADVILLGYPLMVNMTEDVRRNDLLVYEKVTPGGPAMTWGMFAIGWLELGQLDKANSLFARQFDNVRSPFYAWSENANGPGAANFITGMGGYLQSVIFGYGGLRVYDDRISLRGNLPLSVTSMNIIGIDYLDGSLDVLITKSATRITLTKTATRTLEATDSSTGKTQVLILNQPLTFSLAVITIFPM